jgi:hypothetical protein
MRPTIRGVGGFEAAVQHATGFLFFPRHDFLKRREIARVSETGCHPSSERRGS